MRPWLIAAVLLIAMAVGAPAQAKVVEISDDTWAVSGSLAGVRPPDHPIRQMYVSRIGPNTAEGLEPLAAFHDLRGLALELVDGVDLSPLAELELDALSLRYVRNVDLAPLGRMPRLVALTALNVRNVRVPASLELAASLRSLSIANDGFRETGAPVKSLIEAIDWSGLGRLRDLELTVTDEPIRVDLAVLGELHHLRRLEIPQGIHDALPRRSPFAALAPTLRQIEIDAWRPRRTERALQRRYPRASVFVIRRYRWDPSQRDFTIYPPARWSPGWSTYGSLWEAFDGRYGETEYAALRAGRRLIRRAAPHLLRRLDFDQEADGTGISARRRADLIRALRILGIR